MAFLFHESSGAYDGSRRCGFDRYREILERDFKQFMLLNLFTIIAGIPALAGIAYALFSSSLLLLILFAFIGGAIAGPFLSALFDSIFRSMRDCHKHYIRRYFYAAKQNAPLSILIGAVTFCFYGMLLFLFMMWTNVGFPSFLPLVVTLVSLLLFTMLSMLSWFQMLLFDQSWTKRLLNSILFVMRYFWKMAAASLILLVSMVLWLLFLPYTILLLPLTGIWSPAFLVIFTLYSSIDEAFQLEERIAAAFPDQSVYYETDQEWLSRRKK